MILKRREDRVTQISSSGEWTEKYRPAKLSEVVGNDKAIGELRAWAEAINIGTESAKVKRAAILHGPPGCGKTSAAYALASDMGWEVIELNASDQRNEGVIKSIVGHASRSNTFSRRTRLIILDEADNLHGKEDRGGTRAITEIVKKSSQPVILIANDLYRMGKALQRNCRLIRFQRLRPERIYRVLRKICIREGIDVEDNVLYILASNANGDLRSAINDLQALSLSISSGGERVEEADIVTGERDANETIFEVLRKIYSPVTVTDIREAIASLYSLDKTPEESISWVYENLPSELMEDADILHALRYLSRADIFLGRTRNRENFKFWRYASSLMVCGVSFMRYPRIRFRSPWQRGVRAADRRHEPITDEIAAKISAYCKVPQSYARFYILPFMKFFFKNHQKAVTITQLLRLDIPQIAFLTNDTKIAKRVYQDSITLTKGDGYDKHKHIGEISEANVETSVKVKVEEERVEKVLKEEKEEEVRAEGDTKQRSLTDFLSL